VKSLQHPAFAGLFPLAIYSALSILLTWPLVLGIASDVPGDLGDSLLNMWILGWGAEHLPQLLTGQIGWSAFWNANIFHPDPLALALSEHLVGLSLQILPVYWLTGNIILSYNLLFIATFALSAFGVFLLVRDLTGDTRAAFIAGLVYGFLPYRIASVPHLQVLSSQWMPFALWGLNRFVAPIPDPKSLITGAGALAIGTGALILQNLSCGYYLLYFAPFVPLFVVHRMWAVGTLGTLVTWAGLIAAALVTFAFTIPFLLPYSQAQQAFGFERPFSEVVQFSANLWSYLTASENLTFFGSLFRAYPRPEGETFLGITPWLLALIALSGLVWHRSARQNTVPSVPPWLTSVTAFLSVLVVVLLGALLSAAMFGGFELGPISARNPQRLLVQFAVALTLLLAISARARTETVRILRSPIVFALVATIFAVWLSLGPVPRAGDARATGFGLYGVLYEFVPGFNGVRVPARYAMIAGLFLAVLAGYGFQRLMAVRLPSTVLLLATCFLLLLESAAIPLEINRTWRQNEAEPPARVMPYAEAPPVYARVAQLPAGTVLTEFPFGDAAWEIRYVYYSAAHWKPITNGYSGNFPPKYKERVAYLQRVSRDPDAAWRSLKDSGTTHVVVHRAAFAQAEHADVIEAWLKSHGATELERFSDGDQLFALN
jgi:hypothetical protein